MGSRAWPRKGAACGGPSGRCPTGVLKGGPARGRGAVGGGDSGRAPGPSRESPKLRRSSVPLARAPAGRLVRRLAADLELVRTRGIRLFN